MKKIKVSLIVPVYNVEKYISKCLDSLVNQTLNDIEIIVVNDGTKDNSQKIIDEYVKKYPNKIKSYIKKNGGLSDARNYGIKKATGEYIGFVDSDDYVDLKLYEDMYKKAIDSGADIVGCQVKYVYPDKVTYNKIDDNLFNKSIIESPDILLQLKSYAPNKIYKRSFWTENNFSFPIQYFEDSAIVYNILLMANKIECVYDNFYYYNRVNETAITKIPDKRIYDIFKSCDSILSFYKKNKAYSKVKNVLDAVCIGHIRFRIRTYIRCYEPQMLKEFIQYSYEYLDKKIPDWKKNSISKIDFKDTMTNNLYRLIFKNYFVLDVYICLQKIKHLLKKR
jgi:glycosyltransferase involved in cell wall biosynthesis